MTSDKAAASPRAPLTSETAGHVDPDEAPTVPIPIASPSRPVGAGRHRSPHRPGPKAARPGKTAKAKTPARAGLFGASAAVAMGAVAMVSGLLPGNPLAVGGDTGSGHSGGTSGQVRADAPLDTPVGTPPDTRSESPPPPARHTGPTAPAQRPEVPASRTYGRTPSPTPSAHSAAAPVPAAPVAHRPAAAGITPHGTPDAGPRPARTPVAAPSAGLPADVSAEVSATETAEVRAPEQPAADVHASVASQVVALVNAERAKVGCRPLHVDHRLGTLAQSFSDDMARRGFFDHTDPDGKSPWDRAARRGIRNLGGENIARGHPDAHTVMDAWMRSAGHRQNILNCEYRTLGVGVHRGPGGPWWTQDFGY